jgi:hypothetical protein
VLALAAIGAGGGCGGGETRYVYVSTPPDRCHIPFDERRCRRLIPREARGSGRSPDAGLAFDGDACTVWNAGGFAPQELVVDLGEPAVIDRFVLVPEMTPDGAVRHVIETSLDGRHFEPAHRVEGPLRSGQLQEMVLPTPLRTRFLRIATRDSPSWVAWRDVVLLHCDH